MKRGDIVIVAAHYNYGFSVYSCLISLLEGQTHNVCRDRTLFSSTCQRVWAETGLGHIGRSAVGPLGRFYSSQRVK